MGQRDRHASIDSCVLIDFLEASRIDLIENIWSGRIQLAASVLRKELIGYSISGLNYTEFVFDTEDHYLFSQGLQEEHRRISASDADAITVAHFINGVCVTNDSYARDACKARGVEVAGTLTVLKLNVEMKKISKDAATELIHQMRSNGAYFGDGLVEKFLKDL